MIKKYEMQITTKPKMYSHILKKDITAYKKHKKFKCASTAAVQGLWLSLRVAVLAARPAIQKITDPTLKSITLFINTKFGISHDIGKLQDIMFSFNGPDIFDRFTSELQFYCLNPSVMN